MHSPSAPKLPKRQSPAPRLVGAELESVRESEREMLRKRKGYQSTIMTRGGLGEARTQKATALGA